VPGVVVDRIGRLHYARIAGKVATGVQVTGEVGQIIARDVTPQPVPRFNAAVAHLCGDVPVDSYRKLLSD